MRFVGDWITQDAKRIVIFNDSVINVFKNFSQVNSSDNEAGGVLLGKVHGRHVDIVEATIPTQSDIRERCFFERMQYRHQEIAEQRWIETFGVVRYLGEWHTHPEDYPSPSALDKKEWRKLACSRKDGLDLLVVIIGRKGMHVELISSNGKTMRLVFLSSIKCLPRS